MAKNNPDNPETCRTCGALVDRDKAYVHSDWHRGFEKRVLEIVRKEEIEASRRRSAGGLS